MADRSEQAWHEMIDGRDAEIKRLRADMIGLRAEMYGEVGSRDAKVERLSQALNEVVTNGEWTEGEQCGDWKISKEVYETARDALAGAEDHPVAGWPA